MIPFNKPSVEGRELECVRQAIANSHISGDGPSTKRGHAALLGKEGEGVGAAPSLVERAEVGDRVPFHQELSGHCRDQSMRYPSAQP